MSPRSFVIVITAATLLVFAQQVHLPAVQNGPGGQGGGQGKSKPGGSGDGIATFAELPFLSGNGAAVAVNATGTVIVGHSFDSQDILHPVKWMLQNGVWTITALPFPSDATSAEANDVNNNGDVAGYDYPLPLTRALFWNPAGGFTVLGCGEAGPNRAFAISASAQVVVGNSPESPALWRPGGCREQLPVLVEGRSATATAVNGDGTMVGGTAGAHVTDVSITVPVRWRNNAGQWGIEQLDLLTGSVRGGNAAGDLAGHVDVPCGPDHDCVRAVIWFAAGGSRQLGTLGGDNSSARDVNASGEVVGLSTSPRVGETAFYWSESAGMVQLPFKGRAALASSLSDVRPDGTRLAVGSINKGGEIPVVWIIRNQ